MSIKPLQLRLKVAWFKNFLGLAVDQVNTNQQYFLTPYYFWPRTQAWEQLKLELDSKVWLIQEEKTRILKITGDIMEYWLTYRNNKNFENFKDDFRTEFVIINYE